ncbi:MAG TPA: head GIN domain-containing protein [Pyrinomonadaceae bacterium]|nr:head GIN domain-containing protein [Pyrinomonadaceae bacterium]
MRTITSVLLIALAATLAGCHGLAGQVRGSGKRIVQKRDIGDFKSISAEGAYDIRVVCQQANSFEIEGDDNVLAVISAEVNNGTLRLKSLRNFSVSEPIIVRISIANLEALSASGAGKIDVDGINNERFEIEANGAPTIRVAGTTKVLDISSNGASKIDTHKLDALRAVVESNGVSKIDIDVKDQLDVTINGPSQVTYDGNPVVNKTIRGPGKLEKKSSEGA